MNLQRKTESNIADHFELVLRAMVIVACVLAVLAVWEQPKISDDWDLTWQIADAGSFFAFLHEIYMGWGGRLLSFSLIGLVFSSELATGLFKLLTVPCFIVLTGCVCYLADGKMPRFGAAYILPAVILWLGVPVASDTVVWLTGATVYLWPVTMGLLLLCGFRHLRDLALAGRREQDNLFADASWLLAGTVVGTSHEQLITAMFVVLAGWGWILWRSKSLSAVSRRVWFGVAGLIAGVIILFCAPGNFVRLGAQDEGGGLLSMLVRYGIYLGGAYFGLGVGDAGRTLWLGMAVIALSGSLTLAGTRGKDSALWLAASLATLAPMLPLVNFVSPRTTFMAVVFLLIALLTAFPRRSFVEAAEKATHGLILLALASVLIIDCFVGWTANRALGAEIAARLGRVEAAVTDRQNEVRLPYLATMPSRLTHMLSPGHDAVFLRKLAQHYGLKNAIHDESAGAPKPYSLNPLKALKNSF